MAKSSNDKTNKKKQGMENKGNSKSQTTKKAFYTKRKKEIVFDPDARKEFLCGFSERKRQRRAFGLAMQKVKDRQVKLEERKETKSAVLERVEEAERAKETLVLERLNKTRLQTTHDLDIPATTNAQTTTMYQDEITQRQWGGQVIVTTTMLPLDDDDDDDDEQISAPTNKQLASIDQDQRNAGNVQHFLGKLKTALPAKSKTSHATKFKGKHGAANMKGMGGAANLKMAQKMLSKFSDKGERKAKGKKR